MRVEEALAWWQRAAAAGNRYASDEAIRIMEKTSQFDGAIEWLEQHMCFLVASARTRHNDRRQRRGDSLSFSADSSNID